MVRDRIVCDINNSRIESRLLQERDLTFQNALDTAPSNAIDVEEIIMQTDASSSVQIVWQERSYSKSVQRSPKI